VAQTWKRTAKPLPLPLPNRNLNPQALSPLATGTNPLQLGEENKENPSTLSLHSTDEKPEHRTTDSRKAGALRRSYPQDSCTSLPKIEV
jgi:hypothetical protein